MFQFHPTGLYKLGHPAVRGRARRGRHRAEQGRRALHGALRAHDQGPRARATWSSRAIYQEIKEGRGAGPNGDMVYLDLRTCDPKVIEEKLPDITEFARVYLQRRADEGAGADPADRALRDGRHPHRRRRRRS